MSFKKFLTSKTFFTNLAVAVVLLIALVFLTLQVLKSYTRHGQSNPVPDFYGLTTSEADEIARTQNLRLVVIDSVYSDTDKPGAVVEQVPEAGSGVKENRTIFITINSLQKEKVVLPKLTDISFRQAQVLIENRGLLIGDISYRPSEFNDLVLGVFQDSIEILSGDKIFKGSVVDFVVGRDPENQQTPLPDLIGLNLEEAKKILTNAMLNTGVVLYDEYIKTNEDSANAIIWRQRPDAKITSAIKLGSSVDLWITVDEEKIKKATEKEIQ